MLSIIFDIDDTLYHRQDPFSLAFDKQFPGHESLDHHLLYQTFLKHGNALFEDSMTGRITVEEMRILRIQQALEEFQISISRQEAKEFQTAYLWEQEHLQLAPCYQTMFQKCTEKKVYLGIITNGPSSHQRVKIYAMGLNQWIPEDQMLASGDVGVNKPDPEIFRIAAQKWNLNLEEVIYVGDSYEHDVLASKYAGWKTAVWLDRTFQCLNIPDPAADYIVHSAEELADTIQRIITSEN